MSSRAWCESCRRLARDARMLSSSRRTNLTPITGCYAIAAGHLLSGIALDASRIADDAGLSSSLSRRSHSQFSIMSLIQAVEYARLHNLVSATTNPNEDLATR